MADATPLTEMERLLLMAAAVHGLGPNTNLKRANAAKVVGQALQWAGQMDDEVRRAWTECEYHPAILRWYAALIRMIRQLRRNDVKPSERPGEVLFEGAGNFGTPDCSAAFPHFTSCRLTEHGERIARELLEQNPQYRGITYKA